MGSSSPAPSTCPKAKGVSTRANTPPVVFSRSKQAERTLPLSCVVKARAEGRLRSCSPSTSLWLNPENGCHVRCPDSEMHQGMGKGRAAQNRMTGRANRSWANRRYQAGPPGLLSTRLSVSPVSLIRGNCLHSASMTFPEFHWANSGSC